MITRGNTGVPILTYQNNDKLLRLQYTQASIRCSRLILGIPQGSVLMCCSQTGTVAGLTDICSRPQ